MSSGIVLRAGDLSSKYGFQDGDIVDDYVWSFYEEPTFNTHRVLEKLVKDKLMPLIPGVEIYFQPTRHNPIRCEEEFIDQMCNSDVSVAVTHDDVINAYKLFKDQS